jgi:LmbE family N-acetylglucosaminyl deacetylase
MSKTVLAFGAHPDDVEFGCGGTLLALKESGYETRIIDLTRGENSKRGTPKQRQKEAKEASRILEIPREVYDLGDKEIGFSKDNAQRVKSVLVEHDPILVFAP